MIKFYIIEYKDEFYFTTDHNRCSTSMCAHGGYAINSRKDNRCKNCCVELCLCRAVFFSFYGLVQKPQPDINVVSIILKDYDSKCEEKLCSILRNSSDMMSAYTSILEFFGEVNYL